MKVSKKIKGVLADIQFKKLLTKQHVERQLIGFDKAQKIGLLYDATEFADFEIMKHYVKQVRSQHKDVLALGFVDKKILPEKQFAQYGLDFFTRKHLKWNLVPVSPVVQNFINERFDIIINAAQNKIFPLRYVAAMSNAKYRVGRFDKNHTACYELMIKTDPEAGLKQLLSDIENYLRKIITTHESR